MNLDSILNDVQTSVKSRDDCFERVYAAGYYQGMPKQDARRQFDLDLARDDARRLQLLSAYQPFAAGRRRACNKLNRSLVALCAGAILVLGSAGIGDKRVKSDVRLAGLTALVTAGALGIYYARKNTR